MVECQRVLPSPTNTAAKARTIAILPIMHVWYDELKSNNFENFPHCVATYPDIRILIKIRKGELNKLPRYIIKAKVFSLRARANFKYQLPYPFMVWTNPKLIYCPSLKFIFIRILFLVWSKFQHELRHLKLPNHIVNGAFWFLLLKVILMSTLLRGVEWRLKHCKIIHFCITVPKIIRFLLKLFVKLKRRGAVQICHSLQISI